MKVVLFCGGLGTRIRDYSENVPKPMIPVGQQPILWHVMQYYAHYGHRDFVLCLGYKANVVKEFFLNYRPTATRDFIVSNHGQSIELLGEPEPDPVELLERDADADAGAPPASDPPRVGLAEPRSDPVPAPIAEPLGAAVQDAVESVIAAPAPSVQRVVTRAPLEPVRPAPTIELLLPSVTPAPPAQPTEPPAPTPFCGDPDAIRMTLRIEDARVDRESDPQAVRYRARITNEAGFPVGVRNLLVTAQDSRSGADQFGIDRRPDLQIEGGHAVAIDGSVKLEKYPSPFGRSELCVSFVTDACGRQAPFPITRRCFSISGF